MTGSLPGDPGSFDMHLDGVVAADYFEPDGWPTSKRGKLTTTQKKSYVSQLLAALTTEINDE